MVGRDRQQLRVSRVRVDAVEECLDLPRPPLQVGPKDRRLLLVAHLEDLDLLRPASEAQPPSTTGANVAPPLRVPARGDEIVLAIDRQQVDRRLAPLARLASAPLQPPRAVEADPEPDA